MNDIRWHARLRFLLLNSFKKKNLLKEIERLIINIENPPESNS